ncbi:S-layer homology domain-containing protein [Butyricicoccus sp.]
MKRRLLSAFLAVMMVLTMAPVAFAADGVEPTDGTGSSEAAPAKTPQQQIDGIKGTGTVTLDQDYTEDITIQQGQNITLNLNGKKLTNKTGHTITVEQGATLTINGVGTVDNVTHAKSALVNYGEVVLNNGVTLERSSEKGTLSPYSDGGNSCYTILNDKGATMTINNATVKNSGGYSSAIRNGGDSECNDESHLTIKDGNFSGGLNAVKNDECGILTIDGGTFSNTSQYVIMNWNKATITNGTFSVKDSADAVLFTAAYHANRAVGELIVNNGTFTGNGSQKMVENHYGSSYTGTASITGGTFSSDVSAYVAEGYVQNNGTVERLGETNAVAKIGNTYYKSLVDAYAALPRGEGAAPSEPTTITLLKDSDGGGIGSDKTDNYMNYVIDFNGHTYTVGAPAVGSTGTVSQGIRVLKTSTAKFMNGTLKAANYNQLVQVVHTYGDVTFQDFTVDATEDQYAQIAYEVDNGTLNIKGNSNILAYNGQTGLYVAFWPRGGYTGGTTVNVDTTGKITGKMVYEWDDKADTAEQQTENKAVLNIKNGNFDITNIQTLFTSSLPSNLKVPKIYISGGYFNVDPSAYCVTGKTGVASDKDGYKYKVGTVEVKDENEIKTDTQKGATQATLGDKIAAGDKTAATAVGTSVTPTKLTDTTPITADDKAQALTELVKNKKVTLNQDGTIPQDTTVTVVKETYLDVTVTAYDTTSNTVSMNIAPKYNLIAVAKTGADEKTVPLKSAQDAKVGSTEVKVTLPDAFKGKKVYINHNNGANLYVATADATTGKITFTTNGFSPFTFALTNPDVVAEVNGNAYKSLQDAANAAKDGDEITVVKNDKLDLTFNTTKSVKVKNDTGVAIIVKFNGTNKDVAKDATETFSYTKPSSGSSGGSSSGKTTYKVTTSAVNNGGVNASPSSAEKGATITITLSPDKGYKLDKLTVIDGSGKTVSTVKKSDTVYTFTMPASAVKVGVSYVKATETPSKTTFNDVSANDWFASAVDYVTGKGMMNGTAANTFSPKANTTRGMLMTVLARHAGEDTTGGSVWYEKGMNWAKANGVSDGTNPQVNITREQLAAMLYRYAQNKKYDVSVGEDTNILSYTDAQTISQYAIPAIQWACGAGVMNGKSGSKLDPKGYATRAEVAAMLMRFCENVEK